MNENTFYFASHQPLTNTCESDGSSAATPHLNNTSTTNNMISNPSDLGTSLVVPTAYGNNSSNAVYNDNTKFVSFSQQSQGTSSDFNLELEKLRYFLRTAPHSFTDQQVFNRFTLPNGDNISCIRWNSLYFITGTDIVKILFFRFALLGRQIMNHKKFEEGIFSDLRNLKPGIGSLLEEPKSPFLEFLHRNGCIRTQKKQKVFFWNAVNHEQLFDDALERSRRRDKITTTQSFAVFKNTMPNQYIASGCPSGNDFAFLSHSGELAVASDGGTKSQIQQPVGHAPRNDGCFGAELLPSNTVSLSDIFAPQPVVTMPAQQTYPTSHNTQIPLQHSSKESPALPTKTQPAFNDPLDEILRDNMDMIFNDIGTLGADVFLNDPSQESWQI